MNNEIGADWKIYCRFPGHQDFNDARINFKKYKIPKRIKDDDLKAAHVFSAVVTNTPQCDFRLMKGESVIREYTRGATW